jgi:integral membrane sensor domain MASE1
MFLAGRGVRRRWEGDRVLSKELIAASTLTVAGSFTLASTFANSDEIMIVLAFVLIIILFTMAPFLIGLAKFRKS